MQERSRLSIPHPQATTSQGPLVQSLFCSATPTAPEFTDSVQKRMLTQSLRTPNWDQQINLILSENRIESLFGLSHFPICLSTRPPTLNIVALLFHFPRYQRRRKKKKKIWSLVCNSPLSNTRGRRGARSHMQQNVAYFISKAQALVFRRTICLPRIISENYSKQVSKWRLQMKRSKE